MQRILLAPLATVVLLIAFYLSGREEERAPVSYPRQEVAFGDGDTTNETLNTLVAEVNALDNRLESIRETVEILNSFKPPPAVPQQSEETKRALDELFARYELLESHIENLEQFRRRASVLASTPTTLLSAPEKPPPAHILESYTVPPGTIFFDAVALTALVGKIPVDGALEAPFPVMVLVGEDNIVPGGARIEALKGMMLSGTAIGDKTLQCVSVNIDAVHFVFRDGTIAPTHHGAIPGGEQLDARGSLGWLSDAIGIPCLRGSLISVSNENILANILRDAARGYALGRQSNEVQEIASVEGNILRALTGDADDYSRASALSAALGGLGEPGTTMKPLEAVFVPPGKKVIAHINRQLVLDYLPGSRRIVSGGDPAKRGVYVYPR
jgi:integrating conjugative element protein (TIGR03752 family)